MSLKTRLRISIVALVTVVVVAVSALYLDDFTTLAFEGAEARAELVANQVAGYIRERIDQKAAERQTLPTTLAELKPVWNEIVRTDPLIPAMLQRTLANADVVVDIHVSGEDGRTLVTTSPDVHSKPGNGVLDFANIKQRGAFRNLWDLAMLGGENYSKTLPLGVAGMKSPLFRITVMIRSSLLWDALRPAFRNLAMVFFVALVSSIFLASALPHFVLNPLERLSRRIDLIRTGEPEPSPEIRPEETQEFAAVQSKLNLLGQQFRGAKQDALQLRSNIEEMLQRLEEAVFLFDASGRLMMAGHPAERLLGKTRDELVGHSVEELFPFSTVLGGVIGEAIQRHEPLHDRMVEAEPNGKGRARLLVNVEILRNNGSQREIGTIITLRDTETRRQLELQLDVSSRLAAISRLTGGVAHEIKNPLNAMALHLEVLKSKLDAADPEIEVISKEIKRLDHVVKTFLNFNKPVELHAQPLDLTALAAEVLDLIEPQARSKGVQIEKRLDTPHWINGDADLLKQGILNVVVNAVEAMQGGGKLIVQTDDLGSECVLGISDNGPGIPPEIQDKIFNLYFSTKKSGSGIGLAMTFRMVQVHSGSIEFSSVPGKGTAFNLRFPSMRALEGPPAAKGAHS